MWVSSLGQVDSLEEGMTTHSSILAWSIPWSEDPGRLQFMGSQRVGHNWSDWACMNTFSLLLLSYSYIVILLYPIPQSVQVWCMKQGLRAGALGWPRGLGWGGRWEGGSGWGTHVNPWLIHTNIWQKPLQYCKVISLQLI